MSVKHDVRLSSNRWRANNHQAYPTVGKCASTKSRDGSFIFMIGWYAFITIFCSFPTILPFITAHNNWSHLT